MYDKVSLIYNTCDKYEPLWDGFFTLFKKYWSEFSGKIILNTEEKSYSTEGLSIERPPKNSTKCTWSERILNSLEFAGTPYVIMTLDDFYFKSEVKVEEIEKCLSRMENDPNIMLFNFAWQPAPNKKDPDSDNFERRGRFSQYRINTQITLWRTSYLKKILRSYENPWQFEINGSFRSSLTGGKLYSLKKDAPLVFDYDYGFLIIRSKLNQEVASYFEEHEGLDMNLPFEPFVKTPPNDIKKGRVFRLFGYAKDMVVSLFKK